MPCESSEDPSNHILNQNHPGYSKISKENKYKDKYDYKDEDKDKEKDAKRKTHETLTVSYIFGILMTHPVEPSTAQYSLVLSSKV